MYTLYIKGYRNTSFTDGPASEDDAVINLDAKFASFDVAEGVDVHYNCLGQCKVTCETREQAEAVIELLRDYEVVAVNPEVKFQVRAQVPNDPLFARQWHLQNLDATVAWDYIKQQGIYRIGVIDTGFMNIQDLNESRPFISVFYKGQLYTNVVGAGCFSLNNNVEFYTSRSDDRNWKTSEGVSGLWSVHGSHVGGIIAARGNNNVGVTGEIWNVYNTSAGIFPIKAFNYGYKYQTPYGTRYTTTGSFDAIYNAIDVAIALGCRVVNMSIGAWVSALYGGAEIKQLFEEKFEAAYNAAGTVFVIAAGNSALPVVSSDPFFGLPVWELPAACTPSTNNVIAVTAAKKDNDIARYSNYHMNLCDIAGYGGAGYDAVEDDILSTAGQIGLCERGYDKRVVTVQGDNTQYMFLAGTSMAAPTVAGAAALVLAKYYSLKTQHLNVDTLRAILRGTCKRHNRNHFFTNKAGGILNLHYALMGVTEYAAGYSPPSLEVYIDEENNVGNLCIKITNNDTATRLCIVRVGAERFWCPYDETTNEERSIGDFAQFLNSGQNTIFRIPLEDLGDNYDKLLGITAYSVDVNYWPFRYSYCNKQRYTIKADCPSGLGLHPGVDVVAVDPRAFFGNDIPDYREFENLFDANAIVRLYRYAHCVLTAAYGRNYPPAGGIVSLPDGVGVEMTKYVLRKDTTQRDIMYALASLHRQLYDVVNNGVYRYSSKFSRGMWYYPIDVVAYYNTGKIKRKRYSDTFFLGYCDIRVENMKRVVYQIFSMLRSLSCLFTVLYSVQCADCGMGLYTARYWGKTPLSFTSLMPVPVNGRNFSDSGSNDIWIDGIQRNYTCDGSNLESSTETPPRYVGITQNTAMGPLTDLRAFPFHHQNHAPYFFKAGGVTVGDVTYYYLPCHVKELSDLDNKTENDTGEPTYTPPSENSWYNLTSYLAGVSHGDRPKPPIGNGTRRAFGIYDSLNDTDDGLYAHSNIWDDVRDIAESYRGVMYKTYSALRLETALQNVLPPIRINVRVFMGSDTTDCWPRGQTSSPLPRNTINNWPVRQTLAIEGYYKIYKNAPSNENLVVSKTFRYSLEDLPAGVSQVERLVDVVTVDIPTEAPGIIVVETGLNKEFAKSQPKATFMLHYTALPVPANGGDVRLVCDRSYVGKPYNRVLAGVDDETFADNSRWDLRFYNLEGEGMVPYTVGLYGYGSYTRNCFIGLSYYVGAHRADFITVPDVRGMFKTTAETLLSGLGLTVQTRSDDRINGVVFRQVSSSETPYEPIVAEMIPPPGFVYSKNDTPPANRKVFLINQVGGTTNKIEYKPDMPTYDEPLIEIAVPSEKRKIYTAPHPNRPYKNVSQKRIWCRNTVLESGLTEMENYVIGGGVYRKNNNGTDSDFTVVFPLKYDIPFVVSASLNGQIYTPRGVKIVYTDIRPNEKDFIPDLIGLKYEEAQSVAQNLGIEIAICGARMHYLNRGDSPYIVSQWPAPGVRYWPFVFQKIKKIYVLLNSSTPSLTYLDVDL